MADENSIAQKTGRKRKFPDQTEAIRKQLYNTGAGYFRKDGTKVEPKVFMFITKCCRVNCHRKLNETEQNQAFESFYSLGSYELRSSFLNDCVSEVEPARRTRKDEQSRRGFTKIYTLLNERVCRTFFCDLLQISCKRVDLAVKKVRDDTPKTITIITTKPAQPMQKIGQFKVVAQKQAKVPDINLNEREQKLEAVVVESFVIASQESVPTVEYLEEESYTIEDEIEVVEYFDEQPKKFDETFVCSCPNGCTEKLPTKTRRQLFQMFWNIGTSLDRNTFVNCCVSENQRSSVKSEDIPTRKFFLKGVEICEKTFTKTLMITSEQIDLSLQNVDSEEEIDPKEKIAAHIKENFKIEPLLDYMCSNFNDENPDCEVSISDYRETFYEKFSLQLIEKETNLSVL